jgi:nitroreductase
MRTARAVRRFTDDPVPDKVLGRCLEAATWAPSGGNQQPWRFIVLRSERSRAAIAAGAAGALDVIQRVYKMQRPDGSDNSTRARSAAAVFEVHDRAADVPLAVLFTFQPLPATPDLLQGASIYPAMQNFLLACRTEGLGAVVTGWAVTGEDELRSAVGVPDDWELASLVVAGWPRGSHGPVRRKPVREVVALDTWDQPFLAASDGE